MEEKVDVDAMLRFAGNFHRYQFILITLFSAINIFSGFHYFGQTFISTLPNFTCLPVDEVYGNLEVNKCNYYVFKDDVVEEVTCTSGYNYSSLYEYKSIVQEFDWVCALDWIPALGQSVFFIGSVFGSLIFGVLADKIGRLHCLVASNILGAVGNLATVFSNNEIFFICSRFVAGFATDTNFVMMYILVMEYIKPETRTLSLNLTIGVFYCISCMVVPWVAIFFGKWDTFLTVISVPSFLVLLFYFIVPESAQWLISKGRIDEALVCFQKVAKFNNKVIPNATIDLIRKNCEKYENVAKSNQENLLGLLKTPKLRRKTLILVFKSMVMTLGYDAISRNVNGLEISPYLVFTITSSTILPACLFILAVQDKIGRKALAGGALLASAAFTATSGIIQAWIEPSSLVTLFLIFVARFSISVAYNSGAQYAVELIPTCVRCQGVSAIHVAGYAASFFSPQILYLSNFWKPFPDVILGILLTLGSIACLFLPETLNKTLPVSLEDGEAFGENEKLFEFAWYQSTAKLIVD